MLSRRRQIALTAMLAALASGTAALANSPGQTPQATGAQDKVAQDKVAQDKVAQDKASAPKVAPTPAKPTPAKQPQAAVTAPTTPIAAPLPGALDAERAHIARYDAAIAAVRDQGVSPEDTTRIQQAVARIAAGDMNGARTLRDAISEPIARKLVDWYRLRSGYGEPPEYRAFLAANPAWPNRDLLTQRMEEAAFTSGGSSAVIRELFRAEPPKTGAGHAALASALLAEGDQAGASRLARTAWRDLEIAASLEAGFLERFGKLLQPEDHKRRLDRLLLDDPRWSTDRNERANMARRMLPLLTEAERTKAQARLAVFQRAANAGALLAALPADGEPADWGLAYHRAQMLRRSGQIEEAAKILTALPGDANVIVSPDAWWAERRAAVYEALKAGKAKLAYEIARTPGPLSANPLKDQAFTAGWLAFVHLNELAAAQGHFEAMRMAADGPLSHARSAYWLGKVVEARGRSSDATAHYKDAARFLDTFHGQLAHRKLTGEQATLRVLPPAAPTGEQIAKLANLDAARAAVIARKAGLDRSISRAFLINLQRLAGTEAEAGMAAHLAEALGDTQLAVRIGKAGIARGFNLITFAYPLHAFPAFGALRTPPEMALLLAVARQESEFNGHTLSGAGARGILQVMPITAKHVCKDYKIKCDIPRLMTDNSYNTMMAAAYIGDRMREFQDSYVLGIAGYNAGPGRARQWMREFGDPRDPKVDPVDWIHRIPFEETREYVQKVLSNLQVYRARLASGPTRLMIQDDLMRARGARASGDVASTAEAAPNAARKGGDDERPRVLE